MPPAATGKLGLPVGGVGRGLGDDAGYRFRLRHLDRVTGRDLGHGGADPVGHSPGHRVFRIRARKSARTSSLTLTLNCSARKVATPPA